MKKGISGKSEEMVQRVASRFRILGEPMRLRLLHALLDGELTITDLMNHTGATQANVSKHLSILESEGLVYKRKEGVSIYCGIADETVFKLCEIVSGGLQKQAVAQAKAINQ